MAVGHSEAGRWGRVERWPEGQIGGSRSRGTAGSRVAGRRRRAAAGRSTDRWGDIQPAWSSRVSAQRRRGRALAVGRAGEDLGGQEVDEDRGERGREDRHLRTTWLALAKRATRQMERPHSRKSDYPVSIGHRPPGPRQSYSPQAPECPRSPAKRSQCSRARPSGRAQREEHRKARQASGSARWRELTSAADLRPARTTPLGHVSVPKEATGAEQRWTTHRTRLDRQSSIRPPSSYTLLRHGRPLLHLAQVPRCSRILLQCVYTLFPLIFHCLTSPCRHALLGTGPYPLNVHIYLTSPAHTRCF